MLKDDAETPRFIQTVTGQGYRFIAPVINPKEGAGPGPSVLKHRAARSDRDFVSELDGWLQSRGLASEEEDTQPKAETIADAEADRGPRTRMAVEGWFRAESHYSPCLPSHTLRPGIARRMPLPPKSGLSPYCL